MLLFLLSLAYASSTCSEALSLEEFQQKLDSIELGFVKANPEQVASAMNSLAKNIPCLNARLSPELAARYHINRGIYAWTSNDEAAMKRSFSIARKTDPQAGIPTHVFPEQHMIHALYAETSPAAYETVSVEPHKGAYCFDGYLMPRRPKDAPTLFQIIDRKEVLSSSYLQSGDPLPKVQKKSKSYNRVALGTGATLLVLGVATQILSQNTHSEYDAQVRDFKARKTGGEILTEYDRESLQAIFDRHTVQYNISLVGLTGGSALIGASLFLEW